jgi:hypothetical protein
MILALISTLDPIPPATTLVPILLCGHHHLLGLVEVWLAQHLRWILRFLCLIAQASHPIVLDSRLTALDSKEMDSRERRKSQRQHLLVLQDLQAVHLQMEDLQHGSKSLEATFFSWTPGVLLTHMVSTELLLHACTWYTATNTTPGIFQSYYRSDLLVGYAPSAISWIGTITSFFLCASPLMWGPIFDRGSVRILVFVGSGAVVFGLIMT